MKNLAVIVLSLIFLIVSGCFEEPSDKNNSEYDEVDSVSEMVSAENGETVATSDNEAAVSITAGALTEDTRISIIWDDPTNYPDSEKLGSVSIFSDRKESYSISAFRYL